MNKEDLLRQFSLHIPQAYKTESLQRVAHLNHAKLRKAAVLIPCVDRPQGLSVILTKRASHLKHHPGQVSFPGGKFEPFDKTLSNTALREAHEEIGLEPNKVQLIGQLPPLTTISQFSVTPFISIVDAPYHSKIDRNEVDSVFEVPAQYLFDPRNLYIRKMKIKGISHQIFAINYKQHFIWGVTAQIIQALQIQLDVTNLAQIASHSPEVMS
ncbi:CoA pyrophosphatase [Vibrio gangliei]|uniref:CoA pyrophosphatase n=1 Tax=Vibrio gangliei TaxID=2077090 RepID=UPI000D01725C|nr:CoA pyrophosphatase [Vibrio gangliei]